MAPRSGRAGRTEGSGAGDSSPQNRTELGYAFTKDVRLTLDVHNALDKDPPFTNGGDSFQVGYNPRMPTRWGAPTRSACAPRG
jgi:outer membrane receptor protein involved in Fe transport